MTPVTRAATLIASAPLAIGVLTPPASADQPVDQVSGPLERLLGPPPPERIDERPAAKSLGRVSAPDGKLRRGCRNYPYRYALKTPTDEWTLEVFLRDRDKRSIASGTFISDADPRAQRARFRFCRWSTRPGRFTIRALVHWYEPDGTGHRAWLDPARFRLRRAG